MKKPMVFAATGDSFITRPYPNHNDESFCEIQSIIRQAEARFTNLEVTIHDPENFPSAVSGGTWATAPASVLQDIKHYGFNLIAWANNHTLDYSYGGLEVTKRYLDKNKFVHAGVGNNLAEASAPKYLECRSGRVALISITSTFHECWAAGDQRPDVKGRPGVNPLRFETNHVITEEMLEQLKKITEVVDINAENKLAVKEGFLTENDNDTVKFGQYQFARGPKTGTFTKTIKKDFERIEKTINEALRQADYVLISIHSHEMEGDSKDQPAEFLTTFAKDCIDTGAHAVIGHGPHFLRGIEIYKNRPIFYSLGDFIFQNETVPALPADFYEKYGLDHTHTLADALDVRSDNNTKGLGTNPYVWESVIPLWSMENGELTDLTLYPIELGYELPRYRRGWPVLSKNRKILERLNKLSLPFGTDIEIDGYVGKIRFK